MVSFDVSDVGSRTRFPDTQSAYVSASEYGGSVGIYAPGRPTTASLVDGEMNIDRTGGSTIVVWPRVLSRQHQRLVFTYANRHGWAILRGDKRNQYTTANLLIREKRSTDYPFGIDQVPCYFGTPENRMHQGETWSAVAGSQYIASPKNIGPGAPQGVTCTVKEFTGGDCLRRLKAYIRRTGGSYTAH